MEELVLHKNGATAPASLQMKKFFEPINFYGNCISAFVIMQKWTNKFLFSIA